jgi:hypothetical protein
MKGLRQLRLVSIILLVLAVLGFIMEKLIEPAVIESAAQQIAIASEIKDQVLVEGSDPYVIAPQAL